MTLPNFLIIGAMKAGTTSLYRDLLTNPAVFMPQDKEPESLTDDDVLSAEGRAAYERLFAGARDCHRMVGEASTAYTKRPDFEGSAQRARQLLGPDVKVIYLVREPISRIVSHHHHDCSADRGVSRDINVAVRSEPRLLNWTRYAMQVQPWLDAFGDDNVCLIQFETYISDRRECIERLCDWFDVPFDSEALKLDAVYNRSEGKPVLTSRWQRIATSGIYRRTLRPLLSIEMRERIRNLILPKSGERPAPPTLNTVNWILDQLADDLAELQLIMGRSDPIWDAEKARRKFTET